MFYILLVGGNGCLIPTFIFTCSVIACGLTFLALVFSLMLLRRPSAGTRISSALTLGMSLLAAFITTIVFLIDVIFVAVVRKDVRKDTDGIVTGNYGPVVCRFDFQCPLDILNLAPSGVDGTGRNHIAVDFLRWRLCWYLCLRWATTVCTHKSDDKCTPRTNLPFKEKPNRHVLIQ